MSGEDDGLSADEVGRRDRQAAKMSGAKVLLDAGERDRAVHDPLDPARVEEASLAR
jgi:hypothetical protein